MNLVIRERDERSALDLRQDAFRSITEWKRLLTARGLLTKTSDPNVYQLTDPHGHRHEISFAEWRHRNPDKTFLMIAFRWRDPKKVGRRVPLGTSPSPQP